MVLGFDTLALECFALHLGELTVQVASAQHTSHARQVATIRIISTIIISILMIIMIIQIIARRAPAVKAGDFAADPRCRFSWVA